MEGHLQDHGGLSVVHISMHSRETNLNIRVGLLGPYCRRSGELWARPPVLTPVPSHSELQLLPSPSVPDGSDSPETCTHVPTPWSVFRNSNGLRKKSFLCVTVWSLGLVVGTWKHSEGRSHGTTDT